jgi:protein KIBRA
VLWFTLVTLLVPRIANLKIQLAKLDSEAWPGVLDSERDRLILISEKEELLKEMRFVSPRKWTQGEVEQLEMARRRLEKDLQAARDTQSKALTERWGRRAMCVLGAWSGGREAGWPVL